MKSPNKASELNFEKQILTFATDVLILGIIALIII